jgi:Rha family phage regulatory protein
MTSDDDFLTPQTETGQIDVEPAQAASVAVMAGADAGRTAKPLPKRRRPCPRDTHSFFHRFRRAPYSPWFDGYDLRGESRAGMKAVDALDGAELQMSPHYQRWCEFEKRTCDANRRLDSYRYQLENLVAHNLPSPTIPCGDVRLTLRNGHYVASSSDIAAHFEKQHKHVLRDIRELLVDVSEDFATHNFLRLEATGDHDSTPGRTDRHVYVMTREGFSLLAMGFTGRRAVRWKEAYIAAFNRAEADFRRQLDILHVPGTRPNVRATAVARPAILPANEKPRLRCQNDGSFRISSRELARVFKKEHFNVIRDIRRLLADVSPEFAESNFELFRESITYIDKAGESVTLETERASHYELTRDGFVMVAMGFTGRRAIQWKEAYVRAFSAMTGAGLAHRRLDSPPLWYTVSRLPEHIPERFRTTLFMVMAMALKSVDAALLLYTLAMDFGATPDALYRRRVSSAEIRQLVDGAISRADIFKARDQLLNSGLLTIRDRWWWMLDQTALTKLLKATLEAAILEGIPFDLTKIMTSKFRNRWPSTLH